jgi:hypothetical protein
VAWLRIAPFVILSYGIGKKESRALTTLTACSIIVCFMSKQGQKIEKLKKEIKILDEFLAYLNKYKRKGDNK